MGKTAKVTVFGPSHLNGPHNSWVKSSSKGRSFAMCKFCNDHINIETMGNSALTSHQRGKKHMKRVAAAKTTPPVRVTSNVNSASIVEPVINNGTSVSSLTSNLNTLSVAPDERSPNTMQSYVGTTKLNDGIMSSEILWTLNTVVKSNSLASNNDIGNIFQKMFPDSKIARGFKLAETKTKYILQYGIMIHFLNLLLSKINQNTTSKWFVVCFDETLNTHLQEKQLDMYIRFWDGDIVLTRYIHSEFLGKARATEIKDCFAKLDGIQSLKYMLQISMDGPNVNLSAHREIEEVVQTQHGHKLLNMGTCGIHQVHNALKAAMNGDTFKIQQFLSALYKMFHETPARRAEYIKATGSNLFPQSFAAHRWADNKRATVRGLEMLPYLSEFCKAHDDRKSVISKITSNSYKVVKEFVFDDKFAKAKLEFFVSLCDKIEPFLVIFQTDRPMAPFLINELNDVVLDVARRYLKHSYCNDKKEKPMEKLEIRNSSQYKNKVNLGYTANKIIEKLLESESVSQSDCDAFYDVCREACIRFLDKLMQRSPAQYKLALNMDCLDPKLIATKPIKAVNHFHKSLCCVVDAELLEPRQVDKVLGQYQRFVDTHAAKTEFVEFNYRVKDHRVDTLFYQTMCGKHEFNLVWDSVKMLLVISHGQASVERGFSINKYASTVNQSAENLVARRVVRDHVNYIGGIGKLEITEPMVRLCKSACSRYKNELENKKRDKTQQEKESKKDVLRRQIEEKKSQIETTKKMMEHWEDQMQKQLKLVSDPEKAKVIDTKVALMTVAEYHTNIKSEKEKMVTLNEELAALNVKFKIV